MHHLIIHIPHSSTHLPQEAQWLATEKELRAEILKLTDWHTDDLFYSAADTAVIATFSRIFCDVERFTDDHQEVMAARGMGVLYTTLDSGRPLRRVDENERKKILYRYYYLHHQALEAAVEKQLRKKGKALIVDAHSFPARPLNRDLDQRPKRPDFNIGTDPFHTQTALIDFSVAYFREQGLSLGINWPYSGALVPLRYYQKNKGVHSIMLEINRSLYLEEGTAEKNKDYPKIREVVAGFLQGLKQLEIAT